MGSVCLPTCLPLPLHPSRWATPWAERWRRWRVRGLGAGAGLGLGRQHACSPEPRPSLPCWEHPAAVGAERTADVCVSSRIAGGSPSQPPPESTPESAQAYLFLFLFHPAAACCGRCTSPRLARQPAPTPVAHTICCCRCGAARARPGVQAAGARGQRHAHLRVDLRLAASGQPGVPAGVFDRVRVRVLLSLARLSACAGARVPPRSHGHTRYGRVRV
jgi:hypothetical protein